jgi:hypothetical protein
MFGWSARRASESATSASVADVTESLCATRVLPKFLGALSTREAPVLLDLGPVVGPNVSFFGERLACQLLIEDFDNLPKRTADPAAAIEALLEDVKARARGGLDGVLCWDVFDRLDREHARALAGGLTSLLTPKGVVHGFFASASGQGATRRRFVIQSETGMKWRVSPAETSARYARQAGEIQKLFGAVTVVDSVLLASASREVLLRKA